MQWRMCETGERFVSMEEPRWGGGGGSRFGDGLSPPLGCTQISPRGRLQTRTHDVLCLQSSRGTFHALARLMSTNMPSPQDAIVADGFFKADDAEIGKRVQQMDEDAVPLASQRGLLFYNTNVLKHPVSTMLK